MPTRQDLIPLLGPLLETMPRATLAHTSAVVALAAAYLFGRAIHAGRRFSLIWTWLLGLAAGVAACVAFASFVHAGTAATDIDPLTVAGLHTFIASRWIQLALLCAGGAAVAWRTAETRAGTSRPGDAPAGEQVARSEAVGRLGEVLVAAEIGALGWPCLRNVVLDLGNWMVEVDHLVRAPYGIVVIETKTYSGFVSGAENEIVWTQRCRGGRTISIPNPAARTWCMSEQWRN